MELLEKKTEAAEGTAHTIGEMLREIGRISPRAARLVEEDLANPEMSLEKCADALKAYAQKHQSGGSWSCAVFRIDPENEAVKVILDFYGIPAEWLAGFAAPAGGKIDLLDLL